MSWTTAKSLESDSERRASWLQPNPPNSHLEPTVNLTSGEKMDGRSENEPHGEGTLENTVKENARPLAEQVKQILAQQQQSYQGRSESSSTNVHQTTPGGSTSTPPTKRVRWGSSFSSSVSDVLPQSSFQEITTDRFSVLAKARRLLGFGGVDNTSATQERNEGNITELSADNDFSCPICMEPIQEAFVTRCGHSFCYLCITKYLSQAQKCPTCLNPLTRDHIYPNFLLNKLLHRVATPSSSTSISSSPLSVARSHSPSTTSNFMRRLDDSQLTLPELNHLLETLLAKKRRLETSQKEVEIRVLLSFLQSAKDEREAKLHRLNAELQVLKEDIKYSTGVLGEMRSASRRDSVSELDGEVIELSGSESLNTSPVGSPAASLSQLEVPNDGAATSAVTERTLHREKRIVSDFSERKRKYNEMEGGSLLEIIQNEEDRKTLQKLERKSIRVKEHFEDLEQCYFETRLKSQHQVPIATFSNTLSSFTAYTHFRTLNTLRYGDFFATSSIVSSIEFDRDAEFFATAGVTKRIKIFEYARLEANDDSGWMEEEWDREERMRAAVEEQEERERDGLGSRTFYRSEDEDIRPRRTRRLQPPHLPLLTLNTPTKISCLSYNTYISSLLASSDYEGTITLHDTHTQQVTQNFDEHEKRAWSVDFSSADPTRLASGSDDCRVKIWAVGQRRSVAAIEGKANICCVKWGGGGGIGGNGILFGSADHHIHYYDLRNTREPLMIFKGHRKAVSYVKWLNSTQFVSASTDSTLKAWSTIPSSGPDPQPICTYTGHMNEKNFVGLSANATGDWISCGSENNAVYTYFRCLPRSVLKVTFEGAHVVTGEPTKDDDPTQFVSSVCWKRNSNVLLAANSEGTIKVLELV